MPEAITYTDARKNLAATMDAVCDSHEPMIITRRKSQAVVMMSLADYNSIAESAYLLQSPANAERLRAAVRADQSGQRARRELTDD
ncbi:MAG: type II toxin-antitoxin system Phd/YefM family antitoxin [Desulfovibrio sp.]